MSRLRQKCVFMCVQTAVLALRVLPRTRRAARNRGERSGDRRAARVDPSSVRPPLQHAANTAQNGRERRDRRGSRGFGACAREFARSGSNLVLSARRVDRLDKLKQEIRLAHPDVKVHCAALDVRDKENVDGVFKSLPAEFKDVDVLVNNAGLVFGVDHVMDVRKEEMDVMLDTNVKGLVYCTQAVLPRMKERNCGHIINLSSVAGKEPYAGGSVYCATKHAVEAITKSLRLELLDTGIRVSSIAPGLVETEFSVVRFRGDKTKADKVYEGLPGGPLTGQDIAETIVFAASRPDHVQIADMLIFPTSQGSATAVARKTS